MLCVNYMRTLNPMSLNEYWTYRILFTFAQLVTIESAVMRPNLMI